MSELERASGVPRSTIYFYIRQGLLPAPQKTADTRALYSEDHLLLLNQVREAKESGRSLSEIRAEIQPRVTALNENGVDLEAQERDRAHATILRVATKEFVRKGYKRTRVEDLIRELGISSTVFYDHFASKRHLLVECFQMFIQWGLVTTESVVAKSDDLIERQLIRIASSLSIHNLSADVLALVSSEALQGEDELRQPVEEAWDDILQMIVDDIAAIRDANASPPTIPDKLLAQSLNEALQGTLTRMLWDKRFSLEEVMRSHVWLWLAIRKALVDPQQIAAELSTYEDRIRQIATAPPPVFADLRERDSAETRATAEHAPSPSTR